MKRAYNQYPEAYRADNTRYGYYTDSGTRVTITAGQDGVTEDWIALLKREHIIECNMLRRGRSKGAGHNRLISLTLLEEELGDKCMALVDPDSDVEANYIAALERAQLARSIRGALIALTPQQRWLLRQVRFDGKTMTEMAGALGVSRPAVKKRLNVVDQRMREHMSGSMAI